MFVNISIEIVYRIYAYTYVHNYILDIIKIRMCCSPTLIYSIIMYAILIHGYNEHMSQFSFLKFYLSTEKILSIETFRSTRSCFSTTRQTGCERFGNRVCQEGDDATL